MPNDLPDALRSRAESLLEGVSRKGLAQRSAQLSDHYRAGGASQAVVSSKADVTAYLVSRLPATYAAVAAVFDEVRRRSEAFAPRSVLDVGAGPGTASWAAVAAWPGIESLSMMDSNREFLDIAAELASGSAHAALSNSSRILGDITRPDEQLPTADLVVVGFALAELPERQVAVVVSALWDRCDGILVLVEPGTPAGFARIRSARAALIESGATVLAPCPHEAACPIEAPDWCHFAQRLARSRDHMLAKSATVPFEDEKFSYLAVSRDALPAAVDARILAPPKVTKAEVRFKLCTAEGITEKTIPRRDRQAYARLRKARWGESLPIKGKPD
jgi:ribosomal protein RSM22 (predicted rRNA methylase)